jgi:hypothetical protein
VREVPGTHALGPGLGIVASDNKIESHQVEAPESGEPQSLGPGDLTQAIPTSV